MSVWLAGNSLIEVSMSMSGWGPGGDTWQSTGPSHPPQPCIPEIIGRAPGEKVKGGRGKREAMLVRQRIVECPVAFALFAR
eukprot:scaffold1367_cov104-Isochrysis_galbana.AAC.2